MSADSDHINSWQFRGAILSVIIAAIIYLGFSIWAGWDGVVDAIKLVDFIGFLLILGLSLVNYLLRFVRWQIYLSALKHSISIKPSVIIYLAGFSLTTTPGKAGELLRGVFLKKLGVSYTNSTAAFLSERLSDLFAIIVLALLGVQLHQYGQFVIIGAVAVGICLLLLVFSNVLSPLQQRLSTQSNRLAQLISRVFILLSKARVCHTPSLIIIASLLSLLAWSAEAYAFYLVLKWMGFNVAIPFAFSVYALSMLAGALSFMPGGLGGAEVVMAGLLILAGMDESQAIAATVIIRLATLWFAVALGAIALTFTQSIVQRKSDSHQNMKR